MSGPKSTSRSGRVRSAELSAEAPSYKEMKAERRAALDLMEDAVAAKRVAEQLSAELRERESWLSGQKEAFQAAMNGESLESSLSYLINIAVRHYHDAAARGSFYIADRAGKNPFHAAGKPDEHLFEAATLDTGEHSSPSGLVTAKGETVIVPDVRKDPRWESWSWHAEKHGYQSCWSFPVGTRDGPVLGTFALYFDRPRDATPHDHELAAVITYAATIIISRYNEAALRKRTERALRKSIERMRLLIEGATDSAIFTTDADGSIDSWNTGSERLYGYRDDEIIGQNFEVLFTDDDRRRGLPGKQLETALSAGRSVNERWHRRKDGSTFFASGVLQPLGENRDEGFVKIARDITERLRVDAARREKELLQTLITAQELERSRIARDLHDELGQQMTALRLKLELAGIQANGDLRETIGEIKDIARKIDEGVDFIAWELRPAALDDLGLIPAIEKYVREWSGYSGVAISFDSKIGEARFSLGVETALYRAIQESLNNVHKHASASNASVRLMSRDGQVVMIVDDNGVGYDTDDPAVRTRGIGLIGMEERVKVTGGTLEIESKPAQGTTVYITVPAEGPTSLH